MHRLRMTITLDYNADSGFYNTDNPQEMAEIDHASVMGNNAALRDFMDEILIDGATSVNVDVGRIFSQGEIDAITLSEKR